jgi:hypothetical protein
MVGCWPLELALWVTSVSCRRHVSFSCQPWCPCVRCPPPFPPPPSSCPTNRRDTPPPSFPVHSQPQPVCASPPPPAHPRCLGACRTFHGTTTISKLVNSSRSAAAPRASVGAVGVEVAVAEETAVGAGQTPQPPAVVLGVLGVDVGGAVVVGVVVGVVAGATLQTPVLPAPRRRWQHPAPPPRPGSACRTARCTGPVGALVAEEVAMVAAAAWTVVLVEGMLRRGCQGEAWLQGMRPPPLPPRPPLAPQQQ